jgi:hypothetical protein
LTLQLNLQRCCLINAEGKIPKGARKSAGCAIDDTSHALLEVSGSNIGGGVLFSRFWRLFSTLSDIPDRWIKTNNV